MVKNTKKKSYAKSYFMIIVGTCELGFAIQNIYSPIGLVTGGFSGLSIVIKSLTASVVDGGIPLWFSNIMLNVPVFILAFLLKGKKFVGRTFFGTFMLSFWLYVLPCVDLTQGDYMLASIFGGIFAGSGMGLVLRGNATTGGTDMVASLIQIKLKHYSVVEIMQVLDGIIVIVGLVSFGLRPTLYAIVAIYITAKVSDSVLEGFKYSKAAYIITEHYEEVAQRIMNELDRGITGLSARGMYTSKDKCVLLCVVSKKEIVGVKEIVAQIDKNAFVIVADVREVLGEGFLEYGNI